MAAVLLACSSNGVPSAAAPVTRSSSPRAMSCSTSASPRVHLGIARPPGSRERAGGAVVIRHQDCHERAGLDLPDKRVRCQAPRICGADYRVNGHPEALLGAVGGVVDIVAAGPTDNQDIYVMRRLAGIP